MKKILILLMAFVISVTLAGCGGGKTEEPSSENGIENDLENHIEEDSSLEEASELSEEEKEQLNLFENIGIGV